jgi:uncharacterized protein with FMN-binding domain
MKLLPTLCLNSWIRGALFPQLLRDGCIVQKEEVKLMLKKKGLILVVALVLVALLIAGCTSASAPEPAKGDQGEKKVQGEGQGFKGPIKVEVTLVDGKITAIEVLEHSETEGVSDPAFAQIPERIITAQSAEVDVATGATMSSKGIMEAVANALGKQ